MDLGPLFRFGPVGTAVLVPFPAVSVARYVFSHTLVDLIVDSRSLKSSERARLEQKYEGAGLSDVDTAIALGVDPSVFRSTLVPVLLVLVLIAVPFVGFAVLRRKAFAADVAAVRRVGRTPVHAAIEFVETTRLSGWIPDWTQPKLPAEKRLKKIIG